MPRLPTDIPVSGPARSIGGVSYSPVTGGTQELGKTAYRIGARKQEREDKAAYAAAKSSVLISQSQILSSLEDDQDFGTYQSRYEQSMNEAMGKARQMIGSPIDREAFDAEMALLHERGRANADSASWEMQKLVKRGELLENMEGLRDSVTSTTDEALRIAYIQASQEMINGYTKFLDPDDAVKLRLETTEKMAIAAMDVSPLETQLEMLRNPKGTVAEFLPEDARAARALQVEGALSTQLLREERARQARQEALGRAIWDQLEDNDYRIDAIPIEQWKLLDAPQQKAMLGYAETMAAGQDNPPNDELLTQMYNLSVVAKNDFLDMDLGSLRSELPRDDYRRLESYKLSLQADEAEAVAKHKELFTNKQVVDSVITALNMDPTPKDGTSEAREVNKIRNMAMNIYNTALAKGEILSNEEFKKRVERSVANEVVVRNWWRDKKTPAYTIDTADEYLEIPEATRERLKAALKKDGRKGTPEQIVNLYRQALIEYRLDYIGE